MKVTIIRKKGKNETITRHPVEDIALFIQMAEKYRHGVEGDVQPDSEGASA